MFSIAPRRRPDPEPRVTITDAVLQHHQDQQHPASRLSAVRPSHITGRSRQRVVGLVPHVTSFARPPIPSRLGSLRMADALACAPHSHRAARLQASPAHDSAVQAATPHPPTRSCADETGTDGRRRRRTPLADKADSHNLSVLGAPLLGRVTPCQRVYIMLSAILPPSVASVGLFLPGWCARAVR